MNTRKTLTSIVLGTALIGASLAMYTNKTTGDRLLEEPVVTSGTIHCYNRQNEARAVYKVETSERDGCRRITISRPFRKVYGQNIAGYYMEKIEGGEILVFASDDPETGRFEHIHYRAGDDKLPADEARKLLNRDFLEKLHQEVIEDAKYHKGI